MDRAELLDGLTGDVLSYAMHGSISEDVVAERIKPEGLDRRFSEFRTLVDLHFVLREDVVAFVRELPRHLREIETSTRTRTRTTNGSVEGRVNWQETIRRRHSESPGNTALFVCDTRTENYDTAENLVLKHLLSVVHTTLENAEEYLDRDYAWVNDSWGGEENLVDELKRVVERNVHVRRIREPDQYEPTDRMLTTAEGSRQELYREAARLVGARNAILDGEPEALRELIASTAITPDDDETLFELFVLFRFIAMLDRMRDGTFEIRTIESGRQEVARFSGEKEVVVYHDNSARDRGLSFRSVPEGKDDEELSRTETVQRMAHRIAEDYFDREFRNQTGRPDVIVLEVFSPDERVYEYLVTEVKNSTNTGTIRTGIKETLEYLAFLRVDDELVHGDDTSGPYFPDRQKGLLVIQDVDEETEPLGEEQPIRIVQASELDDRLESILAELV
ncbi:MAG: hypothetical protein V5A62_16450 [Haloarculaceae archaeon]